MSFLFTSESVSEGHPDKLCDQISDAVLDAALSQDPNSRVAVECFTTTGIVVVGGEMTTKADIDVQDIVRRKLKEIGYCNNDILLTIINVLKEMSLKESLKIQMLEIIGKQMNYLKIILVLFFQMKSL